MANSEMKIGNIIVGTNKHTSISHPEYYCSHPSGIECIDIAQYYNFCIGNVFKYIWRAGLKQEEGKSDKEKQIEDLEKARWYLDRQISNLKK